MSERADDLIDKMQRDTSRHVAIPTRVLLLVVTPLVIGLVLAVAVLSWNVIESNRGEREAKDIAAQLRSQVTVVQAENACRARLSSVLDEGLAQGVAYQILSRVEGQTQPTPEFWTDLAHRLLAAGEDRADSEQCINQGAPRA